MDDRRTYMNKQLVRPDPPSKSGDEADVSYAELHFKTLSDPRVRTGGDGLTSTYSQLNVRKDRPLIDEDEDPTGASGPGELPITAQTAVQERESKENIGSRPYRLICLLCLVTSALIVTVAGLSIYASQISRSQIITDRNCHKFNSTVQYKISENSHLDLSQRTCLKNLSSLSSYLYVLKQMHSDIGRQYTKMEKKYRSLNEAICKLLTSRREQACSQEWIRNEGLCYFISTFESSYEGAKQFCSNTDSKLLEINSNEEEVLVNRFVLDQNIAYWIGKCNLGEVASHVLYKKDAGKFECGACTWYSELETCSQLRYRFICEKTAPLFPDIPAKIRDLCQQPVGPT